MPTLIIAEKPSVAQELAKYLGKAKREDGFLSVAQYQVTWCFGHLFSLAEPQHYDERFQKWRAADLPILPDKIAVVAKKDKGISKQLKIIASLLKTADEVIHAGDPDREGQLLVEWVIRHYRFRKPVKRLWLAAQDSHSIQKALANLKDNQHYQLLFAAAQTRAIADWLVGINLSRAFTLAAQQHDYQGVVSIGRVQTPTLALIVMRDQDISQFVSKTYYVPMLHVGVAAGSFWATWLAKPELRDKYPDGKITDIADAEQILNLPATGIISQVEAKKLKTAPPLPYRLSRLQKEANAKFGLQADDVLTICQALYEKHKLTSYPRTDCDYLPESQHAEAATILQALSQIYPALQPLLSLANTTLKSAAWNDKKISAHHAIIPVQGNGMNISQLNTKEQKVYDLIVRAYLAQFFAAYEYEKTEIVARFAEHDFKATGSVPLKEGWKALYPPSKTKTPIDDTPEDELQEQKLPPVQPQEVGHNLATEAKQKQTQAPKAYTDGTLISDMESVHRVISAKSKDVDNKWLKLLKENAGLGTEATRASIIQTLLDRGFIERKGKQILATDTGKDLIKALPKSVKSPILTAMMEQELSAIENDGLSPDDFLAKQQAQLRELVQLAANTPIILRACTPAKAITPKTYKAKKVIPQTAINTNANSATNCPKCQEPLVQRQRKSDGQTFLACSGFPKCRYIAKN
ncbi:DNA topoisomerase 3 [Agitococcus lubricus]|uniref:DNA topoisomerase n=1 Tax=Agitococcus lubricus TaxID=1077255 RepID=A0A2T5IZ08_9GAMM|nr:DNA topoisomerase 3 [Agitococcus lubricus]PTQ89248.1 DNA topoisomerase-3 [Agitococcus lubricus]